MLMPFDEFLFTDISRIAFGDDDYCGGLVVVAVVAAVVAPETMVTDGH